MYFNVNFNVFFKLIKVYLLVIELYIYQNARCNDKKKFMQFILDKSDNTDSVQYYDISSYPRVATTIWVWIQFDKDKIRYKILVGTQGMVA